MFCAVVAMSTLAACAGIGPEPVVPPAAAEVPSAEQQIRDQIVARAAPSQDIASARLRPDDNCFWFSYVGPVETTELPLLTRDGRHLCGPVPAVPEATAVAAAG
ncbi:hypothetical protein [Loktanella fryxellensis]|nr:hypothetical protein [Loktanella fryxellensis]